MSNAIVVHDDWINPKMVLGEEETDLIGVDGNAGAVMGFVSRALRRSGNSVEVQNAFRREAMSGDYDHLLGAAMTYLGDFAL